MPQPPAADCTSMASVFISSGGCDSAPTRNRVAGGLRNANCTTPRSSPVHVAAARGEPAQIVAQVRPRE